MKHMMVRHQTAAASLGVGFVAALVVAVASILDDYIAFPHPAVQAVTMLLGSGLGFVVIAAVAGWFAYSWRTAVVSAAGNILLALLLYYVAIPVLDLRPGADLGAIARVALVWGAAGVACGVVVGIMAFWAHRGSIVQRSIASGFPIGLILGPVIGYLVSGGSVTGVSIMAVLATTTAVAVGAMILSLRRTRPLLLFVSIGGGILSALALYAVIYTMYY